MTRSRAITAGILCSLFLAAPLQASEFSGDRGIPFDPGSGTTARQIGTGLATGRLIPKHPAVVPGVDWQPDIPNPFQTQAADAAREASLRLQLADSRTPKLNLSGAISAGQSQTVCTRECA